MNYLRGKSIHLWFVASLVFFLALLPEQRKISELKKHNRIFVPTAHWRWVLKAHLYSFADVMWMSWLQGLDYKNPDPNLGPLLLWVVKASPRFYRAYAEGGIFLSVLTKDKESPKEIFELGLKYFPESDQIAYRGAYHAIYECNDEELGARLFARAAQTGAPMWIAASAADMFVKQNKRDLAIKVLQNALQTAPNRMGRLRVREKLDALLKKSP